MGLTLRCARCHDHKYDPVTKEDYYALYGIFASTQFPWAGAEEFASMKRPREHFAPLLAPDLTGQKLTAFQAKIKRLDEEIQKVEKSGPKEKLEALRNERWNIVKTGLPRDMPAAYAVQDAKPRDARSQLHRDVK